MRSVRNYRSYRSGQLRLESLEQRCLLDGDAAGLELSRFESVEDLEEFLVNDAMQQYGDLFGQPVWHAPWFGPVPDCVECMFIDAAAPPESPDHSQTNTQVEGVDETDIVETDGDYLYMLAGSELLIADAWQPDELEVLSRVEIDGQPVGQFLHGDRLAVVSTSFDHIVYDNPWIGAPIVDVAFGMPFPGQWPEPRTQLTVLDVADRSNPTVVQTTELDGAYVSARAIGDHVYLISSSNFGLPVPEITCDDEHLIGEPEDPFWFAPPEGTCRYESETSYRGRIEGAVAQLALPEFSSSNDDGQTVGLLSQATDIFRPVSDTYQNLISVSVFDVTESQLGPVSSTSVPSTHSTTVYGSTDSLYLTNPDWGLGWNRGEASSILKFDIADDGRSVNLSAAGQVPGRLLNSFSMDEYDDDGGNEYLRIATTNGWGQESDNRVYVLQQNDADLNVVGQTTRLAPGEQIFSVRFMGTTGYVVTFRQTDPLFTIDLSEPANPQVIGELHITGFSNYLQSAGDDYLIGLGREADPNTGRARELQVTLFDVSDLSEPALADRFSFDVPDWAWTEAISDHHAVGYYPEYQVLTIPVSNGRGWVSVDRDDDGRIDFETYRPRTDLYVLQLNLPSEDQTEASIELLGTIQHDADVRRSVRIEDYLYSISSNSVAVHPILDPLNETARLNFSQEGIGVPVFESDQIVMEPDEAPPQVARVMAGGSRWDHDVIDHLANDSAATATSTLSLSETDQVKIQFSEDVWVGPDDLRLSGDKVSRYSVLEFTYDSDTSTAVWTLSQSIVADTVDVRLTGVEDLAGNRLDGDSNGRAGGSFRHQFSVLPGDVDGDGRVDRADVASAKLLAAMGVDDGAYRLSHDVDGSGLIDEQDFQSIESRAGTTLPEFVAPIAGDSNRDGRFDQQDLVQVMQHGKYRSGEFASFADGDWNRDGLFDESDFVTAFQEGRYVSGVAAAVDAVFQDESLKKRSRRN